MLGEKKAEEIEHFFHKKELIDIFEKCLNKTLGELDVNHVFDKTKTCPKITGIAGDVVEQSILRYGADNRQRPDLNVDGVKTELKTTGIKKSKGKEKRGEYEAKEPMTITAVSPKKIVEEIFEDSNFWHKLEHLLFVYYLYDSDIRVTAGEYARFPILGYEFFEFEESDKKVLQNDWTIVHDFIKSLQSDYEKPELEYPRISSELRDKLLYIDTAPKYPNNPRFRLKRSVVTNIVKSYFGTPLEHLPETYKSYSEVDKKLHRIAKKYVGKTVNDLVKELKINIFRENKAISEKIILKIFGSNAAKLNKVDFFNKINMRAKSIVLTTKGLRTEDMKLFPIDFEEISDPDMEFENSSFWDYFSNVVLCVVFEEPSPDSPFKDNRFLGFKKISFDEDFLYQQVKPVWDTIRNLIFNHELKDIISIDKKTGKAKVNKTGIVVSAPNFPKSSKYNVFVRGSGIDSTGKTEVINGIKMYPQYIWLKGSFIADMLSDVDFI